ncbi:MAG: YebC/PmpR family DNA-binding transcriptional regulator [Firmicutes bacterium]|jgi:YebC/PmpR family DNA-binding regulatory protein|nr:YebC/PmpR family DNA-binding transcriptional regulator [Bacillota bacterium]MDH7496100.1 YebC/PmpR family DNA-binding transcriptional regulator [Bacillota bacterium]
MSGHSKWANIKHRKAKADAERGRMFTKVAREILVAAREGGPDPEANFRLRMAIDRARAVNMPNDSIMRAIKRGAGESGAETYEEIIYEGYGPGGVAIMVEVMTDNRNRAASDVRHTFTRHGGNLGESGCVAWMFHKKGLLVVDLADVKLSEDDLMNLAVEAGADDFKVDGATVEITTDPSEFENVQKFLRDHGVAFTVAELTWVPKTTVRVTGKDAKQLLSLTEALEELDDVQQVHANFDIPDEEMEAAAEV